MQDDSANLDRLHDLTVPPEVPWWPPAPGWYVVLSLVALAALRIGWVCWRRWKTNEYRRVALRQLESAKDVTSVAELLRRTALAIAPRSTIANLSGDAWLKWLAERCAVPIPDEVRQALTVGIYARHASIADAVSPLDSTKQYVSEWIAEHKVPSKEIAV